MASSAPAMSISDEPPSYDEARNRNNLSPRSPSDVPSLHSPSIIELPHRPAEQDAGRVGGAYDAPDVMPTLSMLGPPAELFPDAAPYYIMLTCHGPTARISGSHQPSLRLIAEYFKKWGRLSPPRPNQGSSVSSISFDGAALHKTHAALMEEATNNISQSGHPLLEVKIFGSRFSQRDYVDVAVITTKLSQDERQVPKGLDINPAMIVGFIQGVLGYRIIHISQDVWHFQRDKVFLVLN